MDRRGALVDVPGGTPARGMGQLFGIVDGREQARRRAGDYLRRVNHETDAEGPRECTPADFIDTGYTPVALLDQFPLNAE